MKKLVLSLGILAALSTAASAQTVKEKLGALEEGLNDASPIIRLATLEEALADGSKAVRTYAMSQALASDDGDMKELAITHFFTTKKLISIELTKSPELTKKEASFDDEDDLAKFRREYNNSINLNTRFPPGVLYEIEKFDPISGSFKGVCLTNNTNKAPHQKVNGSLTGNKIAFDHDCNVMNSSLDNCKINMEFVDSEKFSGEMSCGSEQYNVLASLYLK